MRRVLMVMAVLTALGALSGPGVVPSADAQACPASNPNCKR